MAFSAAQVKQVELASTAYLSIHRPPPKIRPQLDYEIGVEGQSVIIYEVSPDWKDNTIMRRRGVAKTTYVKTKDVWKIFWQRQDLKWHSYSPMPTVKKIDTFFAVVGEDEHCCFFG